jgi:hypothetical protein
LKRWHVSEHRLPPGSIVYFREPTVWERYSWQIASVVAILLIQAGLITVLLREHRRRLYRLYGMPLATGYLVKYGANAGRCAKSTAVDEAHHIV